MARYINYTRCTMDFKFTISNDIDDTDYKTNYPFIEKIFNGNYENMKVVVK